MSASLDTCLCLALVVLSLSPPSCPGEERSQLELEETGAATFSLEPVVEEGRPPAGETLEQVLAILRERVSDRDLGFRATRVESAPDGRIEVRVEPAPKPEAEEIVRAVLTRVGVLEFLPVASGADLASREDLDELPQRGQAETLKVLRPRSEDEPFTGRDLSRVFQTRDLFDYPAIGFELAPERQQAFGRFTEGLVGERVAVVIDGVVFVAPTIADPLYGQSQISGGAEGFEGAQVLELVTALRSAPLPVPLRCVEARREE